MRALPFVLVLVVARAWAAPPPAPTPAPPPASMPAPSPVVVADVPLLVAVLDLKTSAGVEGVGKALSTLVTSEVGQRPGFKAISRNELKALLAHQADARLLGCDQPACLADIGKLANAQRVISGSLEKGEQDAIVFSLTLIDPEGPTILERVAYTWRSAPDDIVDLARPAVDRLLFGKKADAFTGDLDVLAPDGAALVLDDKELGQAPIKPVRAVGIGVHRIEARKAGFLPWGVDVAVSQGETHVVQVDLIDETSVQPVWARWYVWGSALAGVVVIGGTAAGIVTYNYLSSPSKLIVGVKP